MAVVSGGKLIGQTPGTEMFVSFLDVFIREPRFLFQHGVDMFVEFVNVARKGFSRRHGVQSEWHFLQVFFQVHAAIFAGQHVNQTLDKVQILVFLFRGWVDGVVETHGVKKVPHGRSPHRGQHTISAVEIFLGVRFVFLVFFCFSTHVLYI